MKTKLKHIFFASALMAAATNFTACSLDEVNPGEFTMDSLAETEETYEKIVNNCYFAIERYFYGASGASGVESNNWMAMTEATTDLWTYQRNKSTSYTQWFWFYAGASPNTTYTDNFWSGIYDGIGACNIAISKASKVPFKTEEARNAKVAEAHFLRAVYYFNAVEQFGGVTVLTEPTTEKNYHPERTEPMKIYEDIILPDLEFAAQWLPVGNDATTTTPTRKAAIGFLAKAYLQTIEYDASKKYASKALEYAKMLIEDAEKGGVKYNAHLYASYDDVFKESNNYNNKEALWKHRWFSGSGSHGSSSGNYRLNRNDEYFLCNLFNFGAITDTLDFRLSWEGGPSGLFMPTQHLLSLYVQEDGTLDPRFHESFTTEWKANTAYTWDQGTVNRFDRESSVEGKQIGVGELAVKFIMPQDEDYASEVTDKLEKGYLVVDYKDVYDDVKKNVKMTYSYTNPTEGYTSDGKSENLFNNFYPSLNKHNSSNYYVANANKKRNGNLNATFIMRTAEMYLIAAEADIYENGGSNALGYINTIRKRAGANPLSGTPTISMVLNERARELCGEYTRFYDLKRTGMLKDASYLKENHPDLAQFFKPEYGLRPISTNFTSTLEGGGNYYQNPGY